MVTLAGMAALWASLSGAVFDYLRPSMRPWVGVAGVVLLVIGISELVAAYRQLDPGHRSTKVGWLLALPICVAVTVGAGSLGVYAVGRNGTFRDLPDGPTSFDLDRYVQSQSFGGQPVEMTLVDLNEAATTTESRDVLADHSLELSGFIVADGGVRLSRFVISCCAADAAVVQVGLDSDDHLPEDGTWVQVIGTLSSRTIDDGNGASVPVLDLDSFKEISEPELSYEVPVSRIR